jgi:uncharacterized SAM-binding protein YcdF (DUF218 family)
MVPGQVLVMEEKTTTGKGISPAIIFVCVLLIMAGFFYYQFPNAHQKTRDKN